jgi:tetratricopeptide (TPR) repeat protein
MSERLERITPGMDEDEVLGLILDELIARAASDVAEAIRLCAIPHWFDAEILAWLRGEGREPSERTMEILAELTKLTFVAPYHGRGYAYHKSVRDLVLRRWRKEQAGRFREVSGAAVAYCAEKQQSAELPERQRAGWQREEMYHLLAADEERGIALFIDLLDHTSRVYLLGTFDLLLGMADEQAANLSVGNRLWPRFFRGQRALLSDEWPEALEIWEALGREQEQMSLDLKKRLASNLCFLYKDRGEWDKAVECLQRVLRIIEQAGDEPGMAVIYNNLGFLYKDKGQWEKADECFRRGVEILEKGSDAVGTADMVNNLGFLYKDRGQWEEAERYFRRGLAILEKAGDERGMAIVLRNLGFLYKDKGEWEKAEEHLERSLDILESVGDELERVSTLNSLGFLYTDKKEWEKADQCFKRSLRILRRAGDEQKMADVLNYLGSLYRDKEEWEKANACLQRSRKIFARLGCELDVAGVFNNLGLLYKCKGEGEKAARYFQRSLKIWERVGDKMNAATTMYHLALLRHDQTSALLESVVEICERAGHPDLAILRGSREMLDEIKKAR